MAVDLEVIEQVLTAFFVEKLPAYLTFVENEKGDGIVLPVPTIESVFLTQSSQVNNINNYVYAGISTIEPISNQQMATNFSYQWILVLTDKNQKDDNQRKILWRYLRALKGACACVYKIAEFQGVVDKFEFEFLAPADLVAGDKVLPAKAVGITISGVLNG